MEVKLSSPIASSRMSPIVASRVSALPAVREKLTAIQRQIGGRGEVVVEGRDMGTVVFPDADIKFFLAASQKVRAGRRYKELKSASPQTVQDVENEMARRDKNDSSRKLAPLKPASDAIHIDSSELSIPEVVELMLSYIK